MTTIKFGKSMNIDSTGNNTYYVTINSARIEEIQSKDFFNYNLPDLDGSSQPTSDIKTKAQDYKMITRTFTISGEIEPGSASEVVRNGSITTPKTVYDVRDILSYMNLFGGPIKFYYGVSSDYSGLLEPGYYPHTELGYFKSGGEDVLFSRLRIEESSGDTGAFNSSSVVNSPTIEEDFLVSSSTQTYNDSKGGGSPKYGTYNLPSVLTVEIECMIIKEGFV